MDNYPLGVAHTFPWLVVDRKRLREFSGHRPIKFCGKFYAEPAGLRWGQAGELVFDILDCSGIDEHPPPQHWTWFDQLGKVAEEKIAGFICSVNTHKMGRSPGRPFRFIRNTNPHKNHGFVSCRAGFK